VPEQRELPPPTPEEIERIAHDREFALEAIQKWGIARLMNPYAPRRDRRAETVGLGDLVKKVTAFFGVTPCSACEERAKKLNRIQLPAPQKKPCGCRDR